MLSRKCLSAIAVLVALCAASVVVLSSRTIRVSYLVWRAATAKDEYYCVKLLHMGTPAAVGPVYWDDRLLPAAEITDSVMVSDEVAVASFEARSEPYWYYLVLRKWPDGTFHVCGMSRAHKG